MSELTEEDKLWVAYVSMYNAQNSPSGELARTRCDQVFSDLGVENADCSEGKEKFKGMFDTWYEVTQGFGCLAAGGTLTSNKCQSGCLGYDGQCMK